MSMQIFTGTLIGPEGQYVGRWVKYTDVHNVLANVQGIRDIAEQELEHVPPSEGAHLALKRILRRAQEVLA